MQLAAIFGISRSPHRNTSNTFVLQRASFAAGRLGFRRTPVPAAWCDEACFATPGLPRLRHFESSGNYEPNSLDHLEQQGCYACLVSVETPHLVDKGTPSSGSARLALTGDAAATLLLPGAPCSPPLLASHSAQRAMRLRAFQGAWSGVLIAPRA